MNPASGSKLLSTAAVLAVLGPEHTFATRVHGRLAAGLATDVSLIAGGDPSLTVDDLERLASALAEAGVRRIEGGITIDLSYFDGVSTPPAFDTKHTDAGYRPEVPALAVASGVVTAIVTPGKRAGEPVRVTLSLGADALSVENRAVTVLGKAAGALIIEARAAPNGRTRVIVSGTLGHKAPPQAVKKRLADPARIAAELFVRRLAKSTIAFSGDIRFGTAPVAPELARITSAPLAEDIRELNTTSNNFMAETVFKHLGALGDPPARGAATWQRAQARTGAALVALGLQPAGFEIVNGSGLYDGTKVSAEAMTLLLAIESVDTVAARAWRDSLAVAGTSGTLKRRLAKLKGKVRGKTGTLDNAVSLSGYVPSRRCLLAFSVLVNGDIGGRAPAVNRAIDAFVRGLAAL